MFPESTFVVVVRTIYSVPAGWTARSCVPMERSRQREVYCNKKNILLALLVLWPKDFMSFYAGAPRLIQEHNNTQVGGRH